MEKRLIPLSKRPGDIAILVFFVINCIRQIDSAPSWNVCYDGWV